MIQSKLLRETLICTVGNHFLFGTCQWANHLVLSPAEKCKRGIPSHTKMWRPFIGDYIFWIFQETFQMMKPHFQNRVPALSGRPLPQSLASPWPVILPISPKKCFNGQRKNCAFFIGWGSALSHHIESVRILFSLKVTFSHNPSILSVSPSCCSIVSFAHGKKWADGKRSLIPANTLERFEPTTWETHHMTKVNVYFKGWSVTENNVGRRFANPITFTWNCVSSPA